MSGTPAVPRPRIIGHRGAPCAAPEHTLASYRAALDAGVWGVEPDLAPTRDGVLAIRHEPRIDETTDVRSRPSLSARATTRSWLGETEHGVFADDLDWDELREVRAIAPMGFSRPRAAALDGTEGVLRLRELVELVEAERSRRGDGAPVLVVELKHASFFASRGVDLVGLLERELAPVADAACVRDAVYESFEPDVLAELRGRGLPGALVYLVDDHGAPDDRRARDGADARTYADDLTDAGLDAIAAWADGVSVGHRLLAPALWGSGAAGTRGIGAPGAAGPDASTGVLAGAGPARATGAPTEVGIGAGADPWAAGRDLVARARARGLEVFAWTLRPEDRFLPASFAGRPEDYWRAVTATGVDAVFADDPARVRDAFGGA